MVAYAQKFITVEEYLEAEARSETKHEYFNGQIFDMAGASPDHNQIAVNVLAEFRTRLRGTPCRPFNSDQRVLVKATGLRTYPDITVICGKRELDAKDPNAFTNPVVLVEVLSPSTAAYDRGDKFDHYRQIETMMDYLMISPHQVLVEQHTRQADGTWSYRTYTSLEEKVQIASLGCELPLSEIYDLVEFPPLQLR